MLRLLRIANFAIIDSLEVEFGPGLNALTGETGAGKSIIFEALDLTLGGRSSAEAVRAGAGEAVVETLFDLPDTPGGRAAQRILEAAGVEVGPERELIVRRRVAPAGRGRIYLNGALGTAATLAAVGERLVNIHGQHAHQALLRPPSHLGLLDEFAGLDGGLGELAEAVRALREAERALERHGKGARERAQRADILRFQVEELERARLAPGEYEETEAVLPRLRNAERLGTLARELYEKLYEAEGSAFDRLGEVQRGLGRLAELDPAQSGWTEEAASLLAQAESLSEALRAYFEGAEHDPARLEQLESRRALLRELRRKYGSDEAACLAFLGRAREELASLSDEAGGEGRLLTERDRLRAEAGRLARAAAEARRRAAKKLDKGMAGALAELGLKGALFETRLEHAPDPESFLEIGGRKVRLRSDGADACEFFFSPNPGEPPRPLARVASGGELSRLMLALESVLRRGDLIPTLVFDEVDAGIGGAVAEVVGRKLREVSRDHQVLVITHLPQVASLADRHFRIEKRAAKGRTSAAIAPVEGEERVEEIARMGAGLEITQAARAHAKEMLRGARRAGKR
ncbi:MAG: DNA repair protein RecN [Nitrospinota bacterium]